VFVRKRDCLHDDEAIDGLLPEFLLHFFLDLLDEDVEIG
jgi:hypothetical protein